MRLRYLLPAVLWAIIILVVISIPGSSIPSTSLLQIPHFDKLVHLGLFFFLVVFLNYGLYKQQKPQPLIRRHYTISLVAGVIYGVGTELLQHYYISERHGDLADVAANTLGCIMGTATFYYLKKKSILTFLL